MNDRIVSNPKVLGGKPCVRGTRIPVHMVLELVEAGISFGEIRAQYYPRLSEADIKACIAYARLGFVQHPALPSRQLSGHCRSENQTAQY